MITITNIQNIRNKSYDEIWAIMRSVKNLAANVIHVPELAPSGNLFQFYLKKRDTGNWNETVFQTQYVPHFLKELKQEQATQKMTELITKSRQGKSICLYCVCPDETVCHRSVIGGILQWLVKGLNWDVNQIQGLGRDYSSYGKLYSTAAPPLTMPLTQKSSLYSMCFTGVRPNKLCGYERDPYKPFVKQMTGFLRQYADMGIQKYVTGGAQGFDQLTFWAVNALKTDYPEIQNIVYVPFKGQESVWSKYGVFSQQDYAQMLKYADDIKYVFTEKANTKKEASHMLKVRNESMVNETDLVVALQNDMNWKTAKIGGTAHCMQYAWSQRRPIHRLSYTTDSYLTLTDCYDAMID